MKLYIKKWIKMDLLTSRLSSSFEPVTLPSFPLNWRILCPSICYIVKIRHEPSEYLIFSISWTNISFC